MSTATEKARAEWVALVRESGAQRQAAVDTGHRVIGEMLQSPRYCLRFAGAVPVDPEQFMVPSETTRITLAFGTGNANCRLDFHGTRVLSMWAWRGWHDASATAWIVRALSESGSAEVEVIAVNPAGTVAVSVGQLPACLADRFTE